MDVDEVLAAGGSRPDRLEEQYSMVRLMPDYRRRATTSPGRYTNTGCRAGVSTDPRPDGGRGGYQFEILKAPQIHFINRVLDFTVASQ